MLQELYKKEILPKLRDELGYKNVMQIPKLEKIVVSMCTSEAVQNKKIVETCVEEVTTITGQKAVATRARKSIATFKLRKGMGLGARVTLRGDRMYAFFTRLVSIALPRTRDFNGLSKRSFDGRGNYTLGVTEQIIFPEITYDKVDKTRGMNITICTTAKNNKDAEVLLRYLGLPLKK
jgi:large subunit ribosomal protein L5